ncbi:MAG TPA: bifunctional diaminohydroxyphosphoribosylaminopyrimidine deaminase/5-amino-6-(5-phosphoribosylamino)uracil reductase RibD [Steroidobacteraceae bacterium]|nr:bifunctional diaminohydroxyphosphoribosylaminopyrimidine deaminase/5-amino-6-(5-phosphoribosylamino)uracil reductase RibD [Steroidobacteraceae bacterium]
MFSDFDSWAMQRALELAARGLESTDPNPRVGCVIARGEEVVGDGWHERVGEAHAEVAALIDAGERAAGASVYVTLEPCSHQGRTPPCVESLIEARVARVVYAVDDPNPLVDGRGARRLREAGIVVESGLLAEQAAELNAGFLKRMRTGLPWVRLKLAMSLDGRTALASGASRWITGEAARADAQRWRARSSAILTGVGTVLADDPQLDVRLPPEPAESERRQPLRVVLDSHLRTPSGARLLSGGGGEVLILTAQSSFKDVQSGMRLTQRGARIESAPEADGRLSLEAVLARLAELEVNELQVEAGPTLAGELVRQSLVDELLLYVAPRVLGNRARPLLGLAEPAALEEALAFSLIETRPLGEDLLLRLRPRAAAAGG